VLPPLPEKKVSLLHHKTVHIILLFAKYPTCMHKSSCCVLLMLIIMFKSQYQSNVWCHINKSTCNSYNTGIRDLSDMYSQSLSAAGPRAEGIHIRQITSMYVTTNTYHFCSMGKLIVLCFKTENRNQIL